jgi:UrcA family protein
MLDQRIDRAARAVCQLDQAPTGTRIQSRSARACFANARVSAQRQTAAIIASRRSGG